MQLFWRHWRAVLLFYRSVAPASVGITLAMGALLLQFRAEPNYGVPLLLKLLTWPVLLYLRERLQPAGWWWWHNLGYSRGQLWGAAVGLDMLLFGVMLRLIFQ